MHKIIASFDCCNGEIPPACEHVFYRGVRVIEKEYGTNIRCNVNMNKADNKAELHLLDVPMQQWFVDLSTREIIVYKLSTHLKICLDQFNVKA